MTSRKHRPTLKTIGGTCCIFVAIYIVYVSIPRPHIASVEELKVSKWLSFFPYLMNALQHWEKDDSKLLTSPRQTTIKLDKSQNYKRGDMLHATITAFDEAGRRKQYGGDFFFVTLRRPNYPTDGITCETTDNTNGSYSVDCILPWAGQATINAILVHPSESVIQLMRKYSSERHYGIDIYTKMKNSRKFEETTLCSVAFPNKRSYQVCNYSNPTHGEKRTCLKPSSGECSKITWQDYAEDRHLKSVYDRHYFRQGFNFHAPIQGDGILISVMEIEKGAKPQSLKIRQTANYNPMTPTGWFYNTTWNSFKPRKRSIPLRPMMKTCVRNKRLYFVGDSTMRMIYRRFMEMLNLTDTGLNNSVAWSRGRDAKDDSLNLTMQYRSHGSPLLNPGPEDARPYISDTLDAIATGGKGSVVILTIGYHFHALSPDVFLIRLRIIKAVMKNMMQRLPGIQVVIKGLHYHAYDIRDKLWLTYRLEVLLRKEFVGMAGVTFMELWDWTLVSHNKYLHPILTILDHIVDDILDAIC